MLQYFTLIFYILYNDSNISQNLKAPFSCNRYLLFDKILFMNRNYVILIVFWKDVSYRRNIFLYHFNLFFATKNILCRSFFCEKNDMRVFWIINSFWMRYSIWCLYMYDSFWPNMNLRSAVATPCIAKFMNLGYFEPKSTYFFRSENSQKWSEISKNVGIL